MKVKDISKSRILQLCLLTVGVVLIGGIAGLLGQYRVFTLLIALSIASLVVLLGATHRYLVQTRKALNDQFGKNRKELRSLREDFELPEGQSLADTADSRASVKTAKTATTAPVKVVTKEKLPDKGLIGSGFLRPDDDEAALIATTRQRPDLFTKFALRTRSEAFREIFAKAATGMAYGYDEVIESFKLLKAGDEREAGAIRNWNRPSLLALGRVLANQRRSEEDLDAARNLLLGLHWVFGDKALKENDLKLLTEVIQEQGDHQGALTVLDKSGMRQKDPNYYSLIRANSLEPGSVEWLGCVNAVFTRYGLEAIGVNDHGPATLDSITTDATSRVVDGPLVSVIVPTYEGADRIETALRSLSLQTWANLEVIVVDDGSSSQNNEKLREVCALFPEVQLLELGENRGAYIARNAGLKRANGDFITVHDDDDWSHARKIQTQVEHLLEHEDIVANTTGHIRSTTELRFVRINSTPTLIQNNFSSLMFRKQVFDQVGQWDDVNRGGDEEFKNRVIALTGSKIPQVGSAPFSFTRTRDTSLTAGEIDRGYQDPARLFYHSAFSRKHASQDFDEQRRDARPANMEPGMRGKNLDHFDAVFLADFMSAASASSLREARALSNAGYRVGIAHLYSTSGVAEKRFQGEALDAVRSGEVSFVTLNDELSASSVICRDLTVLSFSENLRTPWSVGKIVITSGGENHSRDSRLGDLGHQNIERLFGEQANYLSIPFKKWPILLAHDSFESQATDKEVPLVGRSRAAHSSNWPKQLSDIRLAYTNNESYEVLLVDDFEGLSSKAQTLLRENALLVSDEDFSEEKYVSVLDFWLGFDPALSDTDPDRDILTAMASGVPVILSPEQESVYGEAALYCNLKNVHSVVSRAWRNKDFYRQQVAAGIEFSRNFLGEDEFVEQVRSLSVVPSMPSESSRAENDVADQEKAGEFESSQDAAKEVE